MSHWNALVANLEMRGMGDFYDPRLDDAAPFPIAAASYSHHAQLAERNNVRKACCQFVTADVSRPPPVQNR